jgi:ArsR family transcriptional regulator
MKIDCCKKNSQEMREIEILGDFVKLINEPNRLKIICLLKQRELCVCEIYETLDLPQNLISHHLKELNNLKIVSFRKEGTKVIYFRNESIIAKYINLLDKIIKL